MDYLMEKKEGTDLKALLYNYRLINDLTQQELANIIGVHRTTLIQWEKGLKPTNFNEDRARMIMEMGILNV